MLQIFIDKLRKNKDDCYQKEKFCYITKKLEI